MPVAPGIAEVQSVLPRSPVRGGGSYTSLLYGDDFYSGTSCFVVGADPAPVQRTVILLSRSMCLKACAVVARHHWDSDLGYNAVGCKDYFVADWIFTLVREDALLAQRLLTPTIGDVVRIANEMFLVININGGEFVLYDTWERTRDHIVYERETQQLEKLEQLNRKLAQERQEKRERIANIMLKIHLKHEHTASLQRLEAAQRQAKLEALLRVNDRVKHRRFGEGVVIAITEANDDQQVQVQFADRVIKLVVRIAAMERIN